MTSPWPSFAAWGAAVSIVLSVLASTSAEPLDAQPGDRAGALREYVALAQGRQAYGIYLGAKKVGWLVEEIKRGMHAGREVMVRTEDARFSALFFGIESVMESQSTTFYGLEGDGEIVFARERMLEDGSASEISVSRDKDELVISTQSGGETTSRRTPLARETLRRMSEFARWLDAGPKEGETFEDYSTEWSQSDINVKEVSTFKAQETIVWGGVPTKVYVVEIDIQGVRAEATVTRAGRLIKGRMAALLDVRAEEEEVARNLEGEAIDLLAASSVRIDTPLGDPEQVRALRLKVRGLGDFQVPLSHRQRLHRDEGGGVVLEVLRDHGTKEPRPLGEEERPLYLRSTAALPADHPRMRGLSAEVVGSEKNALARARKLAKWVHENLEQTYAANASSAFQVLENRSGDCTEHALLFVALARSAGLPARQVGGLVYTGDEFRMFGWHAWAEIHDGSQWISVDPMWDQIRVDATHIKLSEGAEDWSWINVAGRLELEVIDFEKD